MAKKIKIFKDEALTNQVIDEVIDLGIVKAGETKRFTFWLLNDTKAEIRELKIDINHDEIKVLDVPKHIEPNSYSSFVIEWSPSITVEEGLRTPVRITAIRLYKP